MRGIHRPLARIAPFAALSWALIPGTSSAEIIVEPVQGSADAALLEELRSVVETAIAEPGSVAAEVDGALRLSAEPTREGVVLTLELIPSRGGATIRECRVASCASAAAQARAMIRAVLKTAAEDGVAPSPETRTELPEPPKRVYPELNAPYDRHDEIRRALGVTLIGVGAGTGLALLSLASSPGDPPWVVLVSGGGGLAALSLMIGPSIPHFRIHNNAQAAWGLVGRTLLTGGAVVFFLFGATTGAVGVPGECDDEYQDCDDSDDDNQAEGERFGIGFGVAFETLALAWAVIDLATVPRAVQRANERDLERKEAERKVPDVALAPIVAPGPNGSTTAGFVFAMRF
jgi:hypothetical protein